MNKKIFILFLICALAFQVSAQNYKKIIVNLNSKDDIEKLAKTGVAIDHFERFDDKRISFFISDYEAEILSVNNINYEIEIDDWNEYSKQIQPLHSFKKNLLLKESNIKFGLDDFNYGSMNGFLTLDEIAAKLDSFRIKYPEIISEKISIGKSIENRDQWVIKISDNPDIDEDEPQVLYTGLIHAREPQSMMTVIYFMNYLLSNYGSDTEVTYLINNRELYFLPVINPDGYEYNYYLYSRSEAPIYKPMWRKNKRDNNGDGIFTEMEDGVDLNRNFGYQWAYNNSGSSGDSISVTYRGVSPFSEPETYNIKTFVESKNFKTCLNYHSYSNLLLIPWNYLNQPTPDSAIFNQYASEMTAYNKYRWGTPGAVLYPVNGSTDDWFYGEQTTKNKVFAMTPELGNGSDGFWPSEDRILEIAEENVFPNMYIAWAAGDFNYISSLTINNQQITHGDDLEIEIVVSNKGLESAKNLTLEFQPNSPYIDIKEKLVIINDIPFRDSILTIIDDIVSINSSAENVTEAELVVKVKNGELVLDEETMIFSIDSPSAVDDETEIFTYNLSQNYPNPFNPSTIINYSLAKSGKVLLQIFNIEGKLVAELVNTEQSAGNYNVTFTPNNNLASGFYFYKLSVNDFVQTKKLLLLK